MSLQAAPAASQRRHWYAISIVGVPVHSPGSAVSVRPSRATPLTVGATVLTGGRAAITGVKALTATALPPAFATVTATRMVAPASSAVRTYVAAVAPATSTHPAPSTPQRRQR